MGTIHTSIRIISNIWTLPWGGKIPLSSLPFEPISFTSTVQLGKQQENILMAITISIHRDYIFYLVIYSHFCHISALISLGVETHSLWMNLCDTFDFFSHLCSNGNQPD